MNKFQFSNVVVVEGDLIGVVVKSWSNGEHDVYVREYNSVISYKSYCMKHFIYSKKLSEEEEQYY